MGSTKYFSFKHGGGALLNLLAIIFGVISTAFVAIRLYLRNELRRNPVAIRNSMYWLGIDDVLICVALVLDIAMSVFSIMATYYGYGNHSSSLTTHNVERALFCFWVTQSLYKAIMACTKTSMLALYLRIFTNKPRLRVFCHFMTGLVVVYAIASIMATIFQCHGVEFAWKKHEETGTCINLTSFWYANAGFSIASDVIIVFTPLLFVCGLQLPKRSKYLLIGVFLVGGIVILASILRMTKLEHGSKAPDPSSGTFVSTIWTTVEANVGIIGACLPMLRQLIVRLFPGLLETAEGVSSNNRSVDNGRRVPAVANDTLFSTTRNSVHSAVRSVFTRSPVHSDLEGGLPRSMHSPTGSEDAILEMVPPVRGIEVKTDIETVITDADEISNASRVFSQGSV